MAEDWDRTALLVIDMQKDFIEDGSPVGVKGGKEIVPNVINAVEIARQRGILVVWKLCASVLLAKVLENGTNVNGLIHPLVHAFPIYIYDEANPLQSVVSPTMLIVREHDPLGRDVELFRRHLYTSEKVGPTSKGTEGAELVEGLIIKEGDYKVVKTRFSAFFSTHLHSVLQGAGINSLVVTGVQTPNCIRQTVFDAVALDYQPVTVLFDATAAATPDVHIANVFDMKNIGVATPTVQEWSERVDDKP